MDRNSFGLEKPQTQRRSIKLTIAFDCVNVALDKFSEEILTANVFCSSGREVTYLVGILRAITNIGASIGELTAAVKHFRACAELERNASQSN